MLPRPTMKQDVLRCVVVIHYVVHLSKLGSCKNATRNYAHPLSRYLSWSLPALSITILTYFCMYPRVACDRLFPGHSLTNVCLRSHTAPTAMSPKAQALPGPAQPCAGTATPATTTAARGIVKGTKTGRGSRFPVTVMLMRAALAPWAAVSRVDVV